MRTGRVGVPVLRQAQRVAHAGRALRGRELQRDPGRRGDGVDEGAVVAAGQGGDGMGLRGGRGQRRRQQQRRAGGSKDAGHVGVFPRAGGAGRWPTTLGPPLRRRRADERAGRPSIGPIDSQRHARRQQRTRRPAPPGAPQRVAGAEDAAQARRPAAPLRQLRALRPRQRQAPDARRQAHANARPELLRRRARAPATREEPDLDRHVILPTRLQALAATWQRSPGAGRAAGAAGFRSSSRLRARRPSSA
jgi:hypothetical protein